MDKQQTPKNTELNRITEHAITDFLFRPLCHGSLHGHETAPLRHAAAPPPRLPLTVLSVALDPIQYSPQLHNTVYTLGLHTQADLLTRW